MPSFHDNPLPAGDALTRALTGRTEQYMKRLAVRTLTAQTEWVEKRLGSAAAGAQAAGVSRSTWRRWAKGLTRRPTPANEEALRRAQRAATMTPQKRARMRRSTKHAPQPPQRAGTPPPAASGGAILTARVQISGDDRVRTLFLGQHLPPGRLDALADAYINGGLDAAMSELNAIVREYIQDNSSSHGAIQISDVSELDFTKP